MTRRTDLDPRETLFEAQIVHGLELAFESNQAYDVLKYDERIFDRAIRFNNSETVEMYQTVCETDKVRFERLSSAAGELIGRESGLSYLDLLHYLV